MALTQQDLEIIQQIIDTRLPEIITSTVEPLLSEVVTALAQTTDPGLVEVHRKLDAMHVHLTNQLRDLNSQSQTTPKA